MEKKGLGKGLGALFPSESGTPSGGVTEVGVNEIQFNPYQPRESIDDAKFQDLVASVHVHGIIQPIVVRTRENGSYELVAGERRLRAARKVGLARIPAVIRMLTDEQSLQMALIENIQREDISAIDAAVAYKRLADEFGMSQEDIATGVGKSRSSIANTMRLLSLPDDVKRMLMAGKLTEGHARAVLALESPNDQVEAAHRIVDAGLSVREAERLTKSMTEPTHNTPVSRETIRSEKDPNLLEAEARLREVLGTKTSIVKWKDRGRIEIEFYSDDDLERILNMLCAF